MRLVVMIVAVCILQNVAQAHDRVVVDPVLTVKGHYRDPDGRVKQHKFPIEIKLLPDGKFVGTCETWLEERDTDGTADLQFYNGSFSGTWTIKDSTIHLKIKKDTRRWWSSRKLIFTKMNGLKIHIEKTASNKPDAGDGK